MSRPRPPKPFEEVLSLLEIYETFCAEQNPGDSELKFEVLQRLQNWTTDHKKLFAACPTEKHGRLWEAIWVAQNIHWDRGEASSALEPILDSSQSLFTGATPRLSQLKSWVGHGFGYEATLMNSYVKANRTTETQRKTALVPGCGRGYDAVVLAKVYGYNVVGLDIAEMAIIQATDYESTVNGVLQGSLKPTNDDLRVWSRYLNEGRLVNPGTVTWIHGDFFKDVIVLAPLPALDVPPLSFWETCSQVPQYADN